MEGKCLGALAKDATDLMIGEREGKQTPDKNGYLPEPRELATGKRTFPEL